MGTGEGRDGHCVRLSSLRYTFVSMGCVLPKGVEMVLGMI